MINKKAAGQLARTAHQAIQLAIKGFRKTMEVGEMRGLTIKADSAIIEVGWTLHLLNAPFDSDPLEVAELLKLIVGRVFPAGSPDGPASVEVIPAEQFHFTVTLAWR